MFYLIQHMWLCLLLAAILGAFLMWLLRNWAMNDKVSEVKAAWQTRWRKLESEHNRLSEKFQEASAQASLLSGLEADIGKLRANYQTLTDRHTVLDADWKRKYDTLEKDWRGKFTTAEKGIADLRGQVTASTQERDTLKANLKDCSQKRITLEEESRKAQAQIDDWSRRFASAEKEATDAKTHVVNLIDERDRVQREARATLEQNRAGDEVLRQRLVLAEQERENLKTQVAQVTTREAEWRNKWQEGEGKHTGAQQQIAGLMTRVATLSALEAKYTMAEERLGGDIERIEGIGPAFGQRLRSVGIAWVVDLLDQCASPEGRATVAEKTGFTTTQLLTWTNMADLLRIPGMTPDWAELLHAAGVDTVKELKQRVPENLQQKMAEVNAAAERKIFSTVPDVATVDGWVQRAKALEFRITH